MLCFLLLVMLMRRSSLVLLLLITSTFLIGVKCTHFRGGTARFHVVDQNACLINVYGEEVMESNFRQFKQRCKSKDNYLYSMDMLCDGCEQKQIQIPLKCDNWRPQQKVSMMYGNVNARVSCDKPILLRYTACCWILQFDTTKDAKYEMILHIANLRRKNKENNRSPNIFIPPVLRVGANRKESFQMFLSDPDGDKLNCYPPNESTDCYNCEFIDNLKTTTKSFVKIHKDCTFTTNFPSDWVDKYYRMVLAVEELDKDDHSHKLSRNTVIILLRPVILPCEQRTTTKMTISPDHKIFEPNVTYTITAESKAACSKTKVSEIVFSLKPDGAVMSTPKFVGDTLMQGMEFTATDKLCSDMIPICTYSMDKNEIQGKPECRKFECRGYHTLSEAQLKRRRKIIAVSISAIVALLLLILLIALLVYKLTNKEGGESGSSVDSSESSTQSTEVPSASQAPQNIKKKSYAMSSVDLDD
ncbi:hypothetical protein ACOME3_010048 [Neoechinorhynchus agilis]